MIFRTEANMKRYRLKLSGLDSEAVYKDELSGNEYTGSSLMNGGILLPQSWGDYFPVEFHLKKI